MIARAEPPPPSLRRIPPPPRPHQTVYIYHYVKNQSAWVAAAGPIQPANVAGVPATYFGEDLAINDKGDFLVVSASRSRPFGLGDGSFYMYKMVSAPCLVSVFLPSRGSSP